MLALVLVASMSGCFGHSKSSTATEPRGPIPPSPTTSCQTACNATPPIATPSASRFSLNDCVQWIANFYAQVADVQAKLPNGYKAQDSTGASQSIVSIGLYDCKSVVLSGSSVLGATQMAVVLLPIMQRQDSVSGRPSFYALEWFASNQTLASRLTQNGMPATVATISQAHAQTPFVASIIFSGKQYGLQLFNQDPEPSFATTQSVRIHHQAQGVNSWTNLTERKDSIMTGLVGSLTYSGGAIQSLPFPPTNPTPIQAGIYSAQTNLDFETRK
jgi:hypothetical protein